MSRSWEGGGAPRGEETAPRLAQGDDKRTEAMYDKTMVDMKKRKTKYNILQDTIADVNARDEPSHLLKERKVANEQAQLTFDRVRLDQERGERNALMNILHYVTVQPIP
ncbi:unnamed protein product [Phytophthora fragariaefolia]|uniref:Unnamed protein product n=1 Tax=Phytophthora fragariaefolia TaxID=1490495 RepID=A0A9W6XBU1_9STRA|nr:unnamed protein product [Phytophthora fragariaefolia]